MARVKDIAARLNVKMPSVTNALKVLKSKDLIDYEKNSFITLTSTGEKSAHKIIRKHEACKDFFTDILNLSPEDADKLACSVEHHISGHAASRIEELTGLIREYSLKDSDFLTRLTEIRNN